jgi:hypothetical protein
MKEKRRKSAENQRKYQMKNNGGVSANGGEEIMACRLMAKVSEEAAINGENGGANQRS